VAKTHNKNKAHYEANANGELKFFFFSEHKRMTMYIGMVIISDSYRYQISLILLIILSSETSALGQDLKIN
jgi:hypothetical protein